MVDDFSADLLSLHSPLKAIATVVTLICCALYLRRVHRISAQLQHGWAHQLEYSETALLAAVKNGNLIIIEKLISAGTKINPEREVHASSLWVGEVSGDILVAAIELNNHAV